MKMKKNQEKLNKNKMIEEMKTMTMSTTMWIEVKKDSEEKLFTSKCI